MSALYLIQCSIQDFVLLKDSGENGDDATKKKLQEGEGFKMLDKILHKT